MIDIVHPVNDLCNEQSNVNACVISYCFVQVYFVIIFPHNSIYIDTLNT